MTINIWAYGKHELGCTGQSELESAIRCNHYVGDHLKMLWMCSLSGCCNTRDGSNEQIVKSAAEKENMPN